jgi:hypothetical protein
MPKVKETFSPKLFILILVLSDKPVQSLFYRLGGQVQAPHATPPVVKKSFSNPMLHHWEWVVEPAFAGLPGANQKCWKPYVGRALTCEVGMALTGMRTPQIARNRNLPATLPRRDTGPARLPPIELP